MPAYWVARARSTIPSNTRNAPTACPKLSRNTTARCSPAAARFRIMEGPDKFRRFIVIEFPTFEAAVARFTSQEYDEAAAFRRSGEVETIIVEGSDAPPH
jgi:uncharacterized protein (DUF1330 family)